MNKLFDSYSWKFNVTGLGGEKTNDHLSKYGNGTATMHDPTVKAILYYATASRNFSVAAVGTCKENTVVEVQESGSTKVAIFSSNTKRFLACNCVNGAPTPYKLGKNADDGTELIMAMLPMLLEDEEFAENYKKVADVCDVQPDLISALEVIKNDPNAKEAMFILCDNAYRRINSENLCIISNTGNITPISELALQQGIYAPTDVIGGTFTVLTASPKVAETVNTKTFATDYVLDKDREFTQFEQSLIPELPEWYIVPKYLESACKMVTSKLSRPVRNIMLRGEAGTGKTEAAKAMAAALHLPYVSICCHPDMMITDFVGTILPKLRSTVTTGELPSFQDIEMDAAYAYSKLTGEEAPENITGDDVMRMIIERAVSENSDNNGLQYEYVDSDLVRAIKYGWLCEIQEPAIIERPGVLTGLNSLLDTCQQVTLPTGEVIKRHPDCVIVVTTNTGYQGCREINNSVISRMQYKKDTELPTDADLKERITGITGFDDDEKLTEMIKVIREIHTFCQERMITDGSCGVRELIDWTQSYMVLGSVVEAAECTIIPSASADVDNQQQIKIACLNPHFTD